MKITRRDFLKYCGFCAASLGISSLQLDRLTTALANPNGPSIIWLNGTGCSGCSISFLNTLNQTIDVGSVLVQTVNLVFHPEFMAVSGAAAVMAIRDTFAQGNFILVIEGGIPTAYEGKTCVVWTENDKETTFKEAVTNLATRASKVIAIGSCAVFGGISAAGDNPTGVKTVASVLGKTVIALPGCPSHPDSLVSTLVKILNNESLDLDEFGRPIFIYGKTIHSVCPLRGKPRATTYGVPETCLMSLGCAGPRAKSNCPTRKWNEGVSWCVGAGAPCMACVEETFPGNGPLLHKPNV